MTDTTAGEGDLVGWFTQYIDRYVEEQNGPDTDALIACLDRVRDSYRLAAQPSAGAQGEADNFRDWRNLGWFSGFARRHGHHVQADWLDQQRIALLAPPAQPDTGDVAEAREWLIGQRRIQASAAVRNGDKTINHTQIVGFIDLCLAALSKPNAQGAA